MGRMKFWIARDKDKSLHMFEDKPCLNHLNRWNDGNINHSRIYSALFPEVTFENSPKQIEIKFTDRMGRIICFLNSLVFRVKLRFDKRVAKEIFRHASSELGSDYYCMCPQLRDTIIRLCGVYVTYYDIEGLFRRYGFTRKNYHEYIKTHYPSLVQYLCNETQWIDVDKAEVSLIIKSKRDFLKFLSDKL